MLELSCCPFSGLQDVPFCPRFLVSIAHSGSVHLQPECAVPASFAESGHAQHLAVFFRATTARIQRGSLFGLNSPCFPAAASRAGRAARREPSSLPHRAFSRARAAGELRC